MLLHALLRVEALAADGAGDDDDGDLHRLAQELLPELVDQLLPLIEVEGPPCVDDDGYRDVEGVEPLAVPLQANLADDAELVKLAQALLDALKDTPAGEKALSKYHIEAQDSEIGVIGDDAHVEGGIHFGKSRR